MSSSKPVYRSGRAPSGCGKIRAPSTACESLQGRVAVRPQEVVPRPRRQIDDLVAEELGRDQPAGGDRGRSRPIRLIVGHHREVDLHDDGSGRLEVAPRRLPQCHHRIAGRDPLPGRAADPRAVGRVVGVDVHPGNPDPASGEGGCRSRGIRHLQLTVRRRAEPPMPAGARPTAARARSRRGSRRHRRR